ncbi:MAG: twin-arginine translocase subunit TatC [Deltaproteobacteria bacterium]|nr:twin-arginine translocase subunit TatC [Deltaproteobacteria bacterium]
MNDPQLPLTAHLEELRKRLIVSGIAWLVAFFACYSFSEQFFHFIAKPVRAALPEGSSLVFIHATEPFFTYLKIGALAAVLVALPVILWQGWVFVAPGLYAREKKFIIPFVISGCVCFGVGAYFGFRHVFPVIFSFLVSYGTATGEINAMLSMGAYLSLCTRLLISFGLVFELPVVVFFLSRMGIVDAPWLASKRKFAIVLAFVFGAVLTPPDIFSQTAIALPFILLYEVSIWVARIFGRAKKDQASQKEE